MIKATVQLDAGPAPKPFLMVKMKEQGDGRVLIKQNVESILFLDKVSSKSLYHLF